MFDEAVENFENKLWIQNFIEQVNNYGRWGGGGGYKMGGGRASEVLQYPYKKRGGGRKRLSHTEGGHKTF